MSYIIFSRKFTLNIITNGKKTGRVERIFDLGGGGVRGYEREIANKWPFSVVATEANLSNAWFEMLPPTSLRCQGGYYHLTLL